ncbi:MAG: DUF692 domain-containing protein [Rhodospirillaceae bacterium]|nr:DUF692 domain-containing protein [Rhodospirillaceae bacterium]
MTSVGTPLTTEFESYPVPVAAGIGLRHIHFGEFLKDQPGVAWLEVHSENYVCPGGSRLATLETIRRNYPLSCHGVGLSLGSAEGLDFEHLKRLRSLVDRFQPSLVSEHMSWSTAGGVYLNDLLPLPYTEEALDILVRNISQAQEALGMQVLIENPSSYVTFAQSTIPEWEFCAETARRSGCGLLLDVNNVYVSSRNHGYDPRDFLNAVPGALVGEIHVAGHSDSEWDGHPVLIDDHGSPVKDVVWNLLDEALERIGPKPVLMEWDLNLPALDVLLGEAAKAQAALDQLVAANKMLVNVA